MVLPHEGILANFTQEYAGLGGSSNYYKLTAKARTYYTISDDLDLIGSLSGGAGYMLPVGGNHLNVFDQFTLGSDDIRGFYDNGLGPRMGANTGDYLGGTTYFTTSAEMSFPLPGIPQDSGFRGAVFMDAATVYGNDVSVTKGNVVGNAMDWRASAGASLIWISPFGPLRLDYAIPFLKQPYDVEQRLKFGIQTSF
jgi:outer membrane protein insertion porin family